MWRANYNTLYGSITCHPRCWENSFQTHALGCKTSKSLITHCLSYFRWNIPSILSIINHFLLLFLKSIYNLSFSDNVKDAFFKNENATGKLSSSNIITNEAWYWLYIFLRVILQIHSTQNEFQDKIPFFFLFVPFRKELTAIMTIKYAQNDLRYRLCRVKKKI